MIFGVNATFFFFFFALMDFFFFPLELQFCFTLLSLCLYDSCD